MIQYQIDKHVYNRLISFKGKVFCKKCGKELKIGDFVKGHRNSGTSKLYHCKCYDQLFIELDDWINIQSRKMLRDIFLFKSAFIQYGG